MKRIVRLTESDLARIVKRVINEQTDGMAALGKFGDFLVNENHRSSQTSAGIPVTVYASMGSTVTPMMLADNNGDKVQGVKVDVNAVTYSVNGQEVKKLQTGNGSEITIVKEYETKYARKIESWLHKRYYSKRLVGEWFKLDDDDINDFIDTCKKIESTIILLIETNPFYK